MWMGMTMGMAMGMAMSMSMAMAMAMAMAMGSDISGDLTRSARYGIDYLCSFQDQATGQSHQEPLPMEDLACLQIYVNPKVRQLLLLSPSLVFVPHPHNPIPTPAPALDPGPGLVKHTHIHTHSHEYWFGVETWILHDFGQQRPSFIHSFLVGRVHHEYSAIQL